MRDVLGDEYVESLRRSYPELPESCDYVMFWWHKAATLVRTGKANRFGLIATNGLPLTGKEKKINELGLCTVLLEIHNELDKEVMDAYGWQQNLSPDESLRRLVALNAKRSREEKGGLVLWLRPSMQMPDQTQVEALMEAEEGAAQQAVGAKELQEWPKKSGGASSPSAPNASLAARTWERC